MANCERCEERHDRIREATYLENDWCLCDDCRDAESEAAWDRFCDDYYGGSGPVTLDEHYQAAVKQRAELRRRD